MVLRRVLVGACLALGIALVASVTSSAEEGRWKLDDSGGCYFDAADSGPDQCDPTLGRWKDDGNGGCYFDAADSGPDQCVPPAEAAATPPAVESARVAPLDAAPGAGRH